MSIHNAAFYNVSTRTTFDVTSGAGSVTGSKGNVTYINGYMPAFLANDPANHPLWYPDSNSFGSATQVTHGGAPIWGICSYDTDLDATTDEAFSYAVIFNGDWTTRSSLVTGLSIGGTSLSFSSIVAAYDSVNLRTRFLMTLTTGGGTTLFNSGTTKTVVIT